MRLEQLYFNFARLPAEDQAAYIASYRLRRARDLSITPSTKEKSRHPETSKIDFSPEEKAVMKLLGLKQRDVLALRALNSEEKEENDSALFQSDLFNEEES